MLLDLKYLTRGGDGQPTGQVEPADVFRLARRPFKIIIINLTWWPTFLNQEISYLKNPDFWLLFKKKKKSDDQKTGQRGAAFPQGNRRLEQDSGTQYQSGEASCVTSPNFQWLTTIQFHFLVILSQPKEWGARGSTSSRGTGAPFLSWLSYLLGLPSFSVNWEDGEGASRESKATKCIG